MSESSLCGLKRENFAADDTSFRNLRELLANTQFENPDIGAINNLEEIDVFVISPPKCGTTALQRGFERLGRKVLHAHNNPTTYAAFPNGELLRQCGVDLATMIRYRRSLKRGPIHVFCGYRDPVGWYLSVAGHFSLPLDGALRNQITRHISDAYPWNRYGFDETRAVIERGVGFDILGEPFDYVRGYRVVSRDNAKVILYRYDRIENLASYIRQEIDSSFSLTRERVNDDKLYLEYLENFWLSRDECDDLFGGPLFSYFFSKDDRSRLIEKYTKSRG